MSEVLVSIGEYHDLNEASVVRSRLESEDITVFLQNEQMVGLGVGGIIPGLYSPRGGALLQVPADQVEHAMAILREADPAAFPPAESTRPAPSVRRGALKLLTAITLLGLFVGLMSLFARARHPDTAVKASPHTPPAVAAHDNKPLPAPRKR